MSVCQKFCVSCAWACVRNSVSLVHSPSASSSSPEVYAGGSFLSISMPKKKGNQGQACCRKVTLKEKLGFLRPMLEMSFGVTNYRRVKPALWDGVIDACTSYAGLKKTLRNRYWSQIYHRLIQTISTARSREKLCTDLYNPDLTIAAQIAAISEALAWGEQLENFSWLIEQTLFGNRNCYSDKLLKMFSNIIWLVSPSKSHSSVSNNCLLFL